jgi:hypothetical protein
MRLRYPVTCFLLALYPVLFLNAQQASADSTYKRASSYRQELRDFRAIIQKHFYDPSSGYYKEVPVPEPGHNPWSYLWPLCAMLQANHEMEVAGEGKGLVDQTLKIIGDYYDPSPPAPGYASYNMKLKGGDRFYDDNQWIGITAMDRYFRLKKKPDLELGKLIYRYMMTGFDTVLSGGIYWQENKKISKNTCSNGPGIILALQLYKATKHRPYLDTAVLLYKWTNEKLQAPSKLFYDNISISTQRVDKRTYTYNTGTMLQSNIYLYELTGDKKYLQEALVVADSSLKYFYSGKRFVDNYWFNAVLFRGYQHLLKHHADKKYITAFKALLDEALVNRRNASGLLMARGKPQNLVAHGGLLEILARFAWLESQKKL